MEMKPIKPNASLLSMSGRKISMSKQVTGLSVDQVKESLLELLEGYEDFVVFIITLILIVDFIFAWHIKAGKAR